MSKSGTNMWCFYHFDLETRFAPQWRAPCHFFNISMSESGANMRCFYYVHFEMCVVPQQRALFQHLNFQRCSGAKALCTVFTWTSSRRNAVHFLNILTSKSALGLKRSVHVHLETCFAPPCTFSSSELPPNPLCFYNLTSKLGFAPQPCALL